LKVLFVFGTRPEGIKMAPIIKEIEKRNNIESYTCVTGQHREMLDQVLEIFDIKPDYDLNIFKSLESVVDLIYNPLNTKLILDAKKLGLKTMSGLLMLVAQAFYAAEIFLNEKLDENLIEEMYSKIKRNMENIILIGMPSSGKTTMGRLLSKKLNREFFDTDNLIEEEENLSVSEIFENKGEKYFRDLETKILEEVSKKNSIVIATGGGTPIKEVNRDMILQNSIVIYLNRNIEKLETFGRPLSKNLKTLEKMYDKRNPIYSDLSDIKINVIEDKEKTLELILEEFEKYENFSNWWP